MKEMQENITDGEELRNKTLPCHLKKQCCISFRTYQEQAPDGVATLPQALNLETIL